MSFDRTWVDTAAQACAAGDHEAAIAAALTGFLIAFADSEDQREREDQLTDELVAYEESIDRVNRLADSLDRDGKHGARLKPVAFGDLAARIRAALDPPNDVPDDGPTR